MTSSEPYIQDTDPPGKALILSEGLRLFATKGLSATSIRDIAAATGLSNPSLYKHFKTKHDLAVVLFERLYRAHLQRLTLAMNMEQDFEAKFRWFIDVYLNSYDDHPHAMIFTNDNLAALWPDVSPAMKQHTVISLLRELLELGRRDGSVNADEDIDLQLALVAGMLAQIARQLYFGTLEGPASEYAEGIERVLRAGLA